MLSQAEMNSYQTTAWQNMQNKGLHDGTKDTAEHLLLRISLTMTEASEAIQEVKRHWGKPSQKEHEAKTVEELSDVILRLLDMAGCHLLKLMPMEWPATTRLDRTSVINYLGKIGALLGNAFDNADIYESDMTVGEFRKEVIALKCSQVIAMCESLATALGHDLWAEVTRKNNYNATRPHKFGTPDAAVVVTA